MKPFKIKGRPKKANDEVFSLRIDPERGRYLKARALASGLSAGSLIRQMVEHCIDELRLEEAEEQAWD